MTEHACIVPDVCGECGAHTYPSQGFCRNCLSENLTAIPTPFEGKLLAATILRHSFDEAISAHLPLTLCSLETAGGAVIFALSQEKNLKQGEMVSVDVETWPFGERLTAKRIKND